MLEDIKIKLKCWEIYQEKDAFLNFELSRKTDSVYLTTEICDSDEKDESSYIEFDYDSIDLLMDVLSRNIVIDSFNMNDGISSYCIHPYFLCEDDYKRSIDKLFYDFNITIEKLKSSKSQEVEKIATFWINQSELYKTIKYIQKYMIEKYHPDEDY